MAPFRAVTGCTLAQKARSTASARLSCRQENFRHRLARELYHSYMILLSCDNVAVYVLSSL